MTLLDALRELRVDAAFGGGTRERRVGEVARLFFEQGLVVLCTFVSAYREDRDAVRALLSEGGFFEIHVVSAARPKGAVGPCGGGRYSGSDRRVCSV